jgi:heme exporter protein A
MQGRTFAPFSVEAENLACSRGGRLVFRGLSFRLTPGMLLAVVGPNGSGKSSLLRLIAGLLRPEAGQLRVEGDNGGEARDDSLIHYLGHSDALKPALTLGEMLRFWAALLGASALDREHLGSATGIVGLGHALDLPTRVLSAGQRRRAGLARLLLAGRPIWLLDEPEATLDQEGRALLESLMRDQLAAGGAIIVATHQAVPLTPNKILDLAA